VPVASAPDLPRKPECGPWEAVELSVLEYLFSGAGNRFASCVHLRHVGAAVVF